MNCRFLPIVLFVALLASCAKQERADHGSGHDHAHRAPNGGSLVELGQHQFNLEFLHDPATGTLTVHLLNGHANDTVRSDAPELRAIIVIDGLERLLVLPALENPLANERAGDTSVFAAQADWLKGRAALAGFIPEITLRGVTFSRVAFTATSPRL